MIHTAAFVVFASAFVFAAVAPAPENCGCAAQCWTDPETGQMDCYCPFLSCNAGEGWCKADWQEDGPLGDSYWCRCDDSGSTESNCDCESGYFDGDLRDYPQCYHHKCTTTCYALKDEDWPSDDTPANACECR